MDPRRKRPVQDHYTILGLTTTCTPADIKTAYRRLALILHPDKKPNDPNATAKFQKLQEAHEVLSYWHAPENECERKSMENEKQQQAQSTWGPDAQEKRREREREEESQSQRWREDYKRQSQFQSQQPRMAKEEHEEQLYEEILEKVEKLARNFHPYLTTTGKRRKAAKKIVKFVMAGHRNWEIDEYGEVRLKQWAPKQQQQWEYEPTNDTGRRGWKREYENYQRSNHRQDKGKDKRKETRTEKEAGMREEGKTRKEARKEAREEAREEARKEARKDRKSKEKSKEKVAEEVEGPAKFYKDGVHA